MAALAALGSFSCAGPSPDPPASPRIDDPPSAASPASRSAAPPTPNVDPTAIELRFKPKPGDVLYYVIENEFRESAGLPILSYSTYAKDRRCIIQSVLPGPEGSTTQDSAGGWARIAWECDRYEARERGLKEEITFDSLRDSYPTPSLHDLGSIPRSRVTFMIDPATGQAGSLRIMPAPVTGPPARRPLGRTAEKLQLSDANLKQLLDDMGRFYLPGGPKRVGDQWTRTLTEPQRNFGTVTTDVTYTLRAVRPVNDRHVATIDFASRITLRPDAKPAVPATSRPGQRAAEKREFRLERAACSGSVEFDVTRGELVQLNLRRELGFVAEIESQSAGKMALRQGSEQVLRVQAGHSPPPKPVIVGGPKPPKLSGEEQQLANPTGGASTLRRPLPMTSPAPTSGPAGAAMPRPRPRPPGMSKDAAGSSTGRREPRPVRPNVASRPRPTTQPAR